MLWLKTNSILVTDNISNLKYILCFYYMIKCIKSMYLKKKIKINNERLQLKEKNYEKDNLREIY